MAKFAYIIRQNSSPTWKPKNSARVATIAFEGESEQDISQRLTETIKISGLEGKIVYHYVTFHPAANFYELMDVAMVESDNNQPGEPKVEVKFRGTLRVPYFLPRDSKAGDR